MYSPNGTTRPKNFCTIWDDRKRVIFVERFAEQFSRDHPGQTFPQRAAFSLMLRKFSNRVDGSLTCHELRTALNHLGVHFNSKAMKETWKTVLNKNLHERILCDDFVAIFEQDDEEHNDKSGGADDDDSDSDASDEEEEAGDEKTPEGETPKLPGSLQFEEPGKDETQTGRRRNSKGNGTDPATDKALETVISKLDILAATMTDFKKVQQSAVATQARSPSA